MRRLALGLTLLLAAACGTPATRSTASARPSPTATAPTSLTVSAHVIAGVPPRAMASPDGRWLAAMEPPPAGKIPYEPTALLYDTTGAFVARVVIGGGVRGWLSDSSGLLSATVLPQRAPPLAIIETDGRVTTTDIQLSDTVLSRDGKWLVAEQQENCCMNIVQRELRVSPRAGGASRSLVVSTSTDPQPVMLLGIDANDRVVYRDAGTIRRIALAGGTPETLASDAALARTSPGGTSPDGMVVLVRASEPAGWYVVANDRVVGWDDTVGAIDAATTSSLIKGSSAPMWVGPHAILVRTATGVASYDVLARTRTPLAAIATGDGVLAYGSGRLLISRGGRAIVIDAATGHQGDTDIDVGNDPLSVTASALPTGGFVLGTVSATYRID